MENNENKDDLVCCPPFNPELWDDKVFEWENKQFIKDKVCTFLNMPLNFGSAMKRLDAQVKNSNASVQDWLCLSDHRSLWSMDLYLAVDKEIEGATNVTLNGKFYSKVYEGSFKDTGKWYKDFFESVKTKSIAVSKVFAWYTTCPKCAKKYGKNYVVLIGKVD